MSITTIFTDGASRGNPGPGGYGAIVAFDGNSRINVDSTQTDAEGKQQKIIELGGREKNTTNNRMEMTAVIEALKIIPPHKDIEIFTDSTYLINGITKWIHGWQKNNWQTKTEEEVLNKDLWQDLLDVSHGKKIKWKKLSGHSGVPANERCDFIATSFADNKPVELFHGLAVDYGIDLSVAQVQSQKLKAKSEKKTRKKMRAYSYVSAIDGAVETHKTWTECESRVKGKSKARFKKAINEDDEEKIIAEFST